MTDAERIAWLQTANADLLVTLRGTGGALMAGILFIEGAFPENQRSGPLKEDLVAARMWELKARTVYKQMTGRET